MKSRNNIYIKKTIYVLAALIVFLAVPFVFKAEAKAETKKYAINATNFPDNNFRLMVQTNYGEYSNGTYYVTSDKLDEVTKLDLIGTENKGYYTNLKGINLFKNLEELYCSNNDGLTSLNLNENTKLRVLHCNDTSITYLNLNYNTQLEELWCQNCKLTSLNLSTNTKLKELNCRNNNILTLNLATNKDLVTLMCHQNSLTSLGLANNTKLDYLSCYNNKITALDLSKNTSLTQVFCNNNSLTSLNVSECAKLEYLNCSSNKLTDLSVNKCTKLLSLDCSYNEIKNQNLSLQNCKDLKELYCNNNSIENLVINNDGVLHNLKANSTPVSNDIEQTTTYKTKSAILIKDQKTNIYELSADITNAEMDEEAIRALVTRFYFTMLAREPEAGAVDGWTEKLMKKEVNGAEMGRRFAIGEEITKKNISNSEFVARLYRTFLNREGSQSEIDGWVSQLTNGKSREYVLAGFVNSAEFDKFCKDCGIVRGTLTVQNPNNPSNTTPAPDPNAMKPIKIDTTQVDDAQLTAFVKRLYVKGLGREGEDAGVSYWKGCILYGQDLQGNKYDIRTVISKGFFLSKEYQNKQTTNEQFVRDCYAAFFDREPDTAGYNDWVSRLNNNQITRQQMIEHGFGDSKEFMNLIKSYGFVIIE